MDYENAYKELVKSLNCVLELKSVKESGTIPVDDVRNLISEPSESEDERIKRCIQVALTDVDENRFNDYDTTLKDCLAWLEKQCEKELNDDEDTDILQRFAFYLYKDEPNVLYLSNVFVNEECRNKGIGTKILEIADKISVYLKCNSIRLKTENGSNAESLYRKNGYKTLKEEGNQIWLEKQGEQKPTDKVEPKFKVGDWVRAISSGNIFKILSVDNGLYRVLCYDGVEANYPIEDVDYDLAYWTIEDANDGDVLANEEMIVIFKHFEEPSYRQHIVAYIGLDTSGGIQITDETWTLGIDKAKPATKEQRDFLFQKMHEAGYEWDDEEKELRKIEQVSVWSEDDKKLIENKNKLIDKVREKFTIGDWIINKDKIPTLIRSVYFDGYKTTRGCINYHTLDEEYRLWTIQDAKEGDVLEFQKNSEFVIGIMSFINKNTGNINMCCLLEDDDFKVGNFNNLHTINTHPARKEQIEKLFTKMKEAGYEWDPEKKELKMIKPDFQKIQWKGNNLKEIVEFTGKSPKFNDWFKTWEEYENYVHAHNNIFKLFNEDGSHFEVPVGAWIVKTPDGYNVASKSTFIQKHTWSEEDEKNWRHCLHYIDAYVTPVKEHVDWFKNIRNRIQPQQKQEWNEEDEKMIKNIEDSLNVYSESHPCLKVVVAEELEWLKSLKPNHWKPSEEQLMGMETAINVLTDNKFHIAANHLKSIYNHIKSL